MGLIDFQYMSDIQRHVENNKNKKHSKVVVEFLNSYVLKKMLVMLILKRGAFPCSHFFFTHTHTKIIM